VRTDYQDFEVGVVGGTEQDTLPDNDPGLMDRSCGGPKGDGRGRWFQGYYVFLVQSRVRNEVRILNITLVVAVPQGIVDEEGT
jgi:hypothetical protein